MKTVNRIFAIIILSAFSTSCDDFGTGEKLKEVKVVSKSNLTHFGNTLPDGYCRFFYQTHERKAWVQFMDKCEKYSVGDILKGF